MLAAATLLLFAIAPSSCEYKLGHSYATVAPYGATASVQITTQPGCPWSIQEEFPGITILSARSGYGPAKVTYAVDANPSRISRTGYINGYAGLHLGGNGFCLPGSDNSQSCAAPESAFRLTVIVFGRE